LLALNSTRGALIFLRRPLKLLSMHCLTCSASWAVLVATHRPALVTRRVAKTVAANLAHLGELVPAQAKPQKATSGPRNDPITASSMRCGAVRSPMRCSSPSMLDWPSRTILADLSRHGKPCRHVGGLLHLFLHASSPFPLAALPSGPTQTEVLTKIASL
jgi:hypothetical protein